MQSIRKNAEAYFFIGLALLAGIIWYAVFTVEAQAGKLLFAVLDVGQGDAIFIQTENNMQVFIDGGPNDRALAKLGRIMPFWDRSLDLVILTHPHADHLDGLVEVLKRYNVEMVLETGVNHSIPEYEEWRQLLDDKDIKVVIAKAGQRVHLSETAYLDILTPFENFVGESPSNIHNAMIVAKLVHGSATALLMGDAEKLIEYRLLFELPEILDSDILKVGHHGSKTSTTGEFLGAVSPEIAVIQAGRKNRYGHPHQEVLDRLNALEIKIFRTDQDGDINFLSEGGIFSKMR